MKLKLGKSDYAFLSSDHLRNDSAVIATPLAAYFTSILRHGYMPNVLRDCVVIPIPKGLKDPSCSSNYRGIGIASTLSKVLEGVILHKYSEFFTSSDLQFGFKSGYSTTMCTGLIKTTISHYINCHSVVYGCFFDASKAFDLVDRKLLFSYLYYDRGHPPTVIRWYKHQSMCIRWNGAVSEPFCVSNGVRQGGVLSPVLFSVYINGLLCTLQESGVGCHFALTHGLKSKTQLIRFSQHPHSQCDELFLFCGSKLSFTKEVTHLGHILTQDLDDSADISRAIWDLVRKANYILCTFSFADQMYIN